jgi:hypothetical protein
MGPFDNDTALDWAGVLTTHDGVLKALRSGEHHPVLAAGEVIAAACGALGQDGLYQSQSTSLFAAFAASGSDKSQSEIVQEELGGAEYLPEEILTALQQGKLTFDAAICAEAVKAIEATCLGHGELASWSDAEERERAVRGVIERIERYAPKA